MKRSLYVVLAVILIFTGVFTGVSIWQHNRSMSAFAADGYILAGEAETGVVSCDYFSAGTRYARNYEDQVKFVSSMGQKKSVERESFIHYSDGSISAFSAGSLLNLDEVQAGSVTAYFLGEKMVLTSGADGYTIDNNGTELEFRNFLWMVDDLKFLVGGQNMVLSLPSGTSQDLSGYLEVDYIDETIVQICNEEQIWQTVPAGASITLDNGVVIDLGTRSIESGGTVYGTLGDILADLETGGGVAIASNSAMDWRPPTFEFEAIDGQDGEDGEDGEAGEAGETGEAGEAGQAGESGEAGEAGEAGQEGAAGTNGSSGGKGEGGEGGAGGEAAAPGRPGSTDATSALAQVVISDLEYDCYEMNMSFYADGDVDTLVYQTAYVQVLNTKTNEEVARVDFVNNGDSYGWDVDLPSTTSSDQAAVNIKGLQANTEYTVQIGSGYRVGNAEQGTKVFASRTFYTSGDGVEMSIGALTEDSVTVDLTRHAYSNIHSGILCMTFEYEDGRGESHVHPVWSVPFELNGDVQQVLSIVDDGDPRIEGVTSNAPFTITLFTSTGNTTADSRWNIDVDVQEPAGVSQGTVEKSLQVLKGATLKKTPTYGSLLIYESSEGSYHISVNDIADPDGAIQSYNYRIYSIDKQSGEKTLVKQLYSTTGSPVELYVDGTTIFHDRTYWVECIINYNDNEKPYTLIVTKGNDNPFTTGSGNPVIYFVEGTLPTDHVYDDYGSKGPSYLFGNLVVDTTEANVSIDQSDSGNMTNIRVDVTSGGDYSHSITYSGWTSRTVDPDKEGDILENATYATNSKKLYLPVDMAALKQGSAYTFTVYGYVKYSDSSSSYQYLGTALAVTPEYDDENTLDFTLTRLTGSFIDQSNPDSGTYDEEFAVGISLANNWTDKDYPLEVVSARALEVTVSGLNLDGSVSGGSTQCIDLYGSILEGGQLPDGDIWADRDNDSNSNPLVNYLQSGKEYLYVFDTSDFGSVSAYSGLQVEVSAVYDYTYNMASGFPEEASRNMSGYYNEIPSACDAISVDIASDGRPSLEDYDYRQDREQAIDILPILNTGNQGSHVPVTEVLGAGSQDSALAADTVRGYRLTADFKSATMKEVSYYFFTYDDWVEFGESEDAQTYSDILQAAETDEDWADKVTKITIEIPENSSVSAPYLDIVYSQKNPTNSDKAVWNENTQGYVYYTDKLTRGSTWMFAFTEMDGYNMTEDDTEPKYMFPNEDPLYESANTSILRGTPQIMDRQAPEVQMSLAHTEADGSQTWKFTVYDPDQALGYVDADGQLTGWAKYAADTNVTGPKWSYGYIIAASKDNMSRYAGDSYPVLTEDNLAGYQFAEINMGSNDLSEMPQDQVEAIYGYKESAATHSLDIVGDNGAMIPGISWKGTFRMTPNGWDTDETSYYIYLGRSLNESAYVTNPADEEDVYNHGAGYDLTSMPSLRYMTAAAALHEKVLGEEDIAEKTELRAELVNDNLFFYPGSGTANQYGGRIAALEVTVWQKDPASGETEKLGTSTVAYKDATEQTPYVASLNVSGIAGYGASRTTYVEVKAVYDTGLYGAKQDLHLDNASDKLEEAGLQVWNPRTDDKETYLVRQQESDYWYFSEVEAQNTENGWRLGGGVRNVQQSYAWAYILESPMDDTKGTWNLHRFNVTNNAYVNTGASDISLVNTTVTGTGYLTEETGYYTAAAGGWTDQETKKALVLGALGTAAPGLTVTQGDPSIALNGAEVTLDGTKYGVGSLLEFTSPQSSVQFSKIEGYTYSANSFTAKLEMPSSSLQKMKEGESEYEFYPYLFLELYEDTQTQTSGNNMYSELQADGETGYYNINKDIKGTLLTDQKYFGSAVYGGAKDKVSAFTAGAFDTLPALPVSLDDLSTAWECGISLHNLKAGKFGTANSAQNYSLRVYVLPVYENGNPITYDTEDAIENHKVYVQDNDVASAYNALRYYSKSGMYCWFRILTRDANIFIGTTEAEYEAQSYTKKNVELQYSVRNSINMTGSTETFPVTLKNGNKSSIPENYVEYRITDDNGDVVMTHDQIMDAAGYNPMMAGVQYYDGQGDPVDSADSGRNIIVYVRENSINNIYIPSTTNRLTFNTVLAEKLTPGVSYTLEARICYTDASLLEQSLAMFKEADEQWDNKAKEKSIRTIVPSNTDSVTKASFTITAGDPPLLVLSTDYGVRVDQDGLDMKLYLNVQDTVAYNTGVIAEDGTVTAGSYQVKILDQTDGDTEITGSFTSGDWNQGTHYLNTNGQRTLSYDKNIAHGHQYRVEIWGTLNGITHEASGCGCGIEHGAPDECGNILLASSDDNSSFQSYLKIPDSSGIVINSSQVTYTPSTGNLTLRVISGSNYKTLTGPATVTIIYDGGGDSLTLTAQSVTWNSDGSCTFPVGADDKDKITGNCSASYSFHTADGTEYKYFAEFAVVR